MSNYDNLPKTTHYDLNKPDYLNVADIFALNENFDIIDALFYNIKTTADNHYVDEDAHAEAFSKHNTDLQAHSNIFADVNFYVATTGNDNNNGGDATPFRTIQHAVDSIPQGCSKATINIANGTYNEAVLVYNKTTSIISFNGEDKNTTIVNSIQARENSLVSVSKITFNTTGSVSLLFHNTKGRVYDIIINGSANTIGVYAYGSDTDIEETAINNCLRATYNDRGFIQCQKVSGSGNTYAYVTNGGVTLIGNQCTLTGTNFKMITSSGYVIEQKTATSLNEGVADSTTDATDSSKKLATTEFIKKANGWSFPSATWFSIPTNPYTVPANGYVTIRGLSNGMANHYLTITSNSLSTEVISQYSGANLFTYIPVRKGCTVTYGNSPTVQVQSFYFIYANGEVE